MFSRAYRTAITVPPLVWVAVFLLVPYLLMFCYSFWSVSESGTIVHSWNLDNYHELLAKPVYWQTLLRSMWIATRVMFFFHAARLSAGLIPLVPRRRQKGSLLSARHHSAVGELSGACLRLEDD